MKPFIKPRPAAPSPVPAPPVAPAAAQISPNELTIFGVAASIADAEDRAAYLDWACKGDEMLRIRLEERLALRDPKPAAPATPPPAEPVPMVPAASASAIVRPVADPAMTAGERPDAVALVPMSAMQFAASQQPPRHSPVPWAVATLLAVGVGALGVFYTLERDSKEKAQSTVAAALMEQQSAEKRRAEAEAAAKKAMTDAEQYAQAKAEAEKGRDAAVAEVAKAKTDVAQFQAARDQAQAGLKAANDKAVAAQAEVVKLRTEAGAQLRSTSLVLATSLARLGAVQIENRAYAEAETNLRQALQLLVGYKADGWSVIEVRTLLGTALLQRSQDPAAFEEFLAAATAMEILGVPMNEPDKARAAAASKRIIQFFSITGRRKEAADWRTRLAPFSR